jgi:acyl carrier protein
MGLDVVELVLRCEEKFDIRLEDSRLESTRTVGDLFELICEQLNLPHGSQVPPPAMRAVIPRVIVPSEGWTRDTVWSKVVQICVDQLQIEPDDVTYSANFVKDLGAD